MAPEAEWEFTEGKPAEWPEEISDAQRIAALERERDEARAAHDRCFSDCVALQRENARLRAALERIAGMRLNFLAQEIAREALGEER